MLVSNANFDLDSFLYFHNKKSSSVHVGNCFVHVREQTVSKFVYLEFHIWKLLGNELNFQTVSILCKLGMHRLHTLCTLI